MAWIILIIAGLIEIGWAIGLKYTDGFTRPVPSVITISLMIIGMYMLAVATRTLPIGTAYTVWVGIGAVGTAILGMILFGESRDPIRIICLFMIVLGVIGLKAFSRT